MQIVTVHTHPASLTGTEPYLGQEKKAGDRYMMSAKMPAGNGFLREV